MSKPNPQLFGAGNVKPIKRHGWDRIRYACHNPEKGEYCSRTPKSWLLIILFYIVFYACLAGIWFGFLQIFFLTLSDDEPKWQAGKGGLIGKSPGLGLKPAQIDYFLGSSLITYNKVSNYLSTYVQGPLQGFQRTGAQFKNF